MRKSARQAETQDVKFEGDPELANKYLSMALEEISKVQGKGMPILSQAEIRREGGEKPAKPKYTPPDEYYAAMQQKRIQYARECRDLHTGQPMHGKPASFEEWLKLQ
jgi:hypothetical protein